MGLINNIIKGVNKIMVVNLSKDVVEDLSVDLSIDLMIGLIGGLIVGEGRYGSTTPGANKRVGIPPPRPLRNQD